LLAALTLALCRRRKWESPSYLALCAFGQWGILSHIFLDLVTTFGTMIWSPYKSTRPAWIFFSIIDFSFTAILLIPQLLAWAYEDPEHSRRRALIMWLVLHARAVRDFAYCERIGAPISSNVVGLAMVLFAALFLFPAARGWGHRLQYVTWNRVGLAPGRHLPPCCDVCPSPSTRIAFKKWPATENIEVQSIAALPFPPSLFHWDGLIRAPRGVYEVPYGS